MSHCPPITLEGGDPNRQRQFQPFSCALGDKHLETHCWYCLKKPSQLARCAGCHVARFCSGKCQKLGWSDHGHECRSIKQSGGQVPDIATRLLARTVARHLAMLKGKAESDPLFDVKRSHKRPMMDLMSHETEFRQDSAFMSHFDELFSSLQKWAGSKLIGDKELVFQIFCRLRINQLSISNADYSGDVGKGLYPDLACYDHSCCPNACYVAVDGFTMAVHTLDPTVPIDDLTKTFISYVDLASTKQDRRKILRDVWHFDCTCARCEDNNEHILASIKCHNCDQPISIFSPKCAAAFAAGKGIQCGECQFICDPGHINEACSAMNNIRIILENETLQAEEHPFEFIEGLITHYSDSLPDVNVYLGSLHKLAVTYAPDKHTQLKFQLRALTSLAVCYPNNWPLAYQQFNIVNNAVQLNQLKLARRMVPELIELLAIVLGPNHEMTHKATAFKQQLTVD